VRAAGATRSASHGAPGPLRPQEALQHTIGNQAVQQLLSVQREATEAQKKEFTGYVTVRRR